MEHVWHIELSKMVAFLYDFDYDDDVPDEADISLLQLHARMFALADQYDVPSLGALSLRKYSSRCTVSWNSIKFLVSVQDVYETTPSCIRQLRKTACIAIQKHLPSMLQDEYIAQMCEGVTTEYVKFTKDLLRTYLSDPFY
jgi:speckle-type POZ protein